MLNRSLTSLAAISLAALVGCSAPDDNDPASAPPAAAPEERSAAPILNLWMSASRVTS